MKWTRAQNHHNLANKRCSFWQIPNTLDVLSNFFFLAFGLLGFAFVWESEQVASSSWLVFFASIICTGFGSMHYHRKPSDVSLFWDRLRIAIAFESIFSALLCEKLGMDSLLTLFACLVFATLSVVVGYQTGNVLLYVIAQFVPLIVTPFLLIYMSDPESFVYLVGALAFCWLAKITEVCEHQVSSLRKKTVRGPTYEHLLSSVAVGILVLLMKKRSLHGTHK